MDTETFKEGLALGAGERRDKFFWAAINEARAGSLTSEQEERLLAVLREEESPSILVMVIMATPFFSCREDAESALLEIVESPDDDLGKSGLLKSHACTALGKIGARSALPAIKSWLKFLRKSEEAEGSAGTVGPDESRSRADLLVRLIESATDAIAALEAEKA